MIDDIVTRLRDIASLRGNMSGSVIPIACTEAADQIERLRAELAMSRHECQMADDAVQDLQARLIKAMRRD